MSHVLDRAIWIALTTRQAHLARGNGPLRFDADYSLFAASADPRDGTGLAQLIAPGGAIALTELVDVVLPAAVTIKQQSLLHQMIADRITPGKTRFDMVPLNDSDAEEMLVLATLTRPGPFFAKTNR